MANKPGNQNQPNNRPGNASSLGGRPKAFSHVKGIRSEFMMASTGAREKAIAKAKLRANAPKLKKEFHKAHEGPREKLAKPKLHPVPRPKGPVVKEVHTQVEREKQARNRQWDEQMKAWRERKTPQQTPRQRPKIDLRKTAPTEYLAKAEKKKQRFEQLLQQKQANKRRHGRSR